LFRGELDKIGRVELNAASLVSSKRSFQARTTLNKSLLAEVLAIEMQEVEAI
jgi:hypothetical protein